MRKLFGGVLIGCGILIAGLSGLCLMGIVGSVLVGLVGGGNAIESLSMLPLVLIYAGIPLGVGLFFLGRQLLRNADAQTQSPGDQTDVFR